MKDILITSSALILALLALRQVFRGSVSRRMQYALWGLVLVRLLVPNSILNLPSVDFSVLTAVRPVQAAVERQLNMHAFYSRPVREMTPEELSEHNIRVSQVPTADDGSAMILGAPTEPDGAAVPLPQGYLVRDAETGAVTLYAHMAVGPWEILDAVWKTGMVLMGAWFLFSNGSFYWKLRKNRREWRADETCPYSGKRKLYLVDEGVIPSPCLFGGSIYLTPAAAEAPDKLRHVLAHEETHARHLDPLWSLLRCVCLTIYWFDPLVWIAAECAKTDSELACDEGALERLGEAERIPYGETLLSLIQVKKVPSAPLLAATTMTAGKRQLKDRVTRIAQNPRQVMAAVLTVAMLVTVLAACTFTGGHTPYPIESDPVETAAPSGPVDLTGEELAWFNEKFFNYSAMEQSDFFSTPGRGNGRYCNIRDQFANPINLYDKPEDIDLFALFYLEGSILSDEELRSAFDREPEDLPCPAYKLTTAEMDEILMANTGLATADTAKKGVGDFTYDETADTYFWAHGDTNYCGGLDFQSGTRETTADGTVVKLYHTSDIDGNYAESKWYCVTLSDRGEGEYWFVSNQICEPPDIPSVRPSGEPEA